MPGVPILSNTYLQSDNKCSKFAGDTSAPGGQSYAEILTAPDQSLRSIPPHKAVFPKLSPCTTKVAFRGQEQLAPAGDSGLGHFGLSMLWEGNEYGSNLKPRPFVGQFIPSRISWRPCKELLNTNYYFNVCLTHFRAC